jgi:hypothetical protein
VFEFRCNLYAKEGQLGLMDARRDTAVIPCAGNSARTDGADLNLLPGFMRRQIVRSGSVNRKSLVGL